MISKFEYVFDNHIGSFTVQEDCQSSLKNVLPDKDCVAAYYQNKVTMGLNSLSGKRLTAKSHEVSKPRD